MINWDQLVIGPTIGVSGEPVTYTPYLGKPFTITGVFDDAYLAKVMFEDGTSGVTELSAVLGVQLSQFPSPPAQNDTLVVQRTGSLFIVREMQTDSHGWATIVIHPTPNMPLRRGDLVMFVRARKPGDNLLAGVSTRRLVQEGIR